MNVMTLPIPPPTGGTIVATMGLIQEHNPRHGMDHFTYDVIKCILEEYSRLPNGRRIVPLSNGDRIVAMNIMTLPIPPPTGGTIVALNVMTLQWD